MASRFKDLLNIRGQHEVGNLNSWVIEDVPEGALVDDAAIDNFTIVELDFKEVDGVIVRTCKQLTDKTHKQYLISSVEERVESALYTEELCDFYNAQGEQARIILLQSGKRFDFSAWSLNDGVKEIKNGMVAHWDVATKKFIISDPKSPHADYADSSTKFTVVANGVEIAKLCGKQLVRLEVQ
ncbi:phage morphogenesis protein (plasmid) [Clostridium perfringens]